MGTEIFLRIIALICLFVCASTPSFCVAQKTTKPAAATTVKGAAQKAVAAKAADKSKKAKVAAEAIKAKTEVIKKAMKARPIAKKPAALKIELDKIKPVRGEAVLKKAKEKKKQPDNALKSIAEPLSKLVTFSTEGGVLKPKFDPAVTSGNYNDMYQLINGIRQAVGGYGGGGSYGGQTWRQSISGNKLTGNLSFGRINGANRQKDVNKRELIVQLNEVTDKNRELFLSSNLEGAVALTLNGGQDPFILRLQQKVSGEVIVQFADDNDVFSGYAKNFDQFCVTNPEFVQTKLFPNLKEYGIVEPLTRYSKLAQETVVKILSLKEDPRFGEFRKFVAELDSKEFDVREAASKKIKAQYKTWSDLMTVAVSDSSFSFEIRSRLKQILKEESKPEDHRVLSMVIKSKLAQKPDYLVWLLPRVDEKSQPSLIAKLKEVTKEDFGKDFSKWQSWAATKNVAPIMPKDFMKLPDLAKENGELNKVSPMIGQLVNIHMNEGKLAVNEKVWGRQFGNVPISESAKEVQELLKAKGLPESWLKVGGNFKIDSVGYEQVIFEKIQDALTPKTNSSVYYYSSHNNYRSSSSSPNRIFDNQKVNAILERTPQSTNGIVRSNAKVKRDYFKFKFTEKDGARRTLLAHMKKNGEFRLSFTSEKSNAIVQMFQKANGECMVQDIRGANVASKKGESFEKLLGENGDYLKDEIYPIFALAGVNFDSEIGGALNIQDTSFRTEKSASNEKKSEKVESVDEKSKSAKAVELPR